MSRVKIVTVGTKIILYSCTISKLYKPSSWVHLVLLTLSDLSEEQVSVDGKGDVESNHHQSSKVQDNGHVLGTLHARLKGNHLK